MTDLRLLLVFVAILAYVIGAPASIEAEACGYESCHPVKDGFVNVHIVAHTHDDVGWLKTVDQYYYGSKTKIQHAGVQYILDSVLSALQRNPKRRFIYVETAYLWKWWKHQHDTVKHQFRKLIRNGQLELIGGAWSMNDEATTHYHSIIDQFTWGLRKLNETFGHCGRPKIGWQIDPFGHSREMASIFAQLGFDGLFLGRIDYQDKKLRFGTRTPEMIWKGSQNLGNSSIFTSVMYNTYSPPPGFCFDVLCEDDPIIDDKRSPEYNAPKRVQQFLDYVKNMTKVYTTNNVLVTMGEDFTYQDAHVWFKNIDKLMLHANQLQANGSKYNLIYSTPSCYLKAVHEESKKRNLQYPTKTDDFFPYGSDSHAFWTGYFTSKPTIKRFERLGNNFLQVCKQLYALTDLGPEDWVDLKAMREAMGVMQHHDAVTGTEQEHVAHDYARILARGFDECHFTTATALSKIIDKTGIKSDPNPSPYIPFLSCLLSNVSQCEPTENNPKFVATIYNPLSRPVNHYVRLPVPNGTYKVTDGQGKALIVQAIPIPETIANVPGRYSKATQEIIFLADSLPPLGFKSYYVEKTSSEMAPATEESAQPVQLSFDENSGLLSEINFNGNKIQVAQNFFFYQGAVGNNEVAENRSSGAYIFRPIGTVPFTISKKVVNKVYKGELVNEIHQVFNEWTSQIVRTYNRENFVEFDWLIGPIPRGNENGVEVISRYSTNLKSESTFYTDSNGRELLKRVRNFRPTWRVNVTEPVASNYYPVTSKILIRDPNEDLEVAVLTDRAQGGTSLNDGEIELMLHRNCLHDDAFGVGESLDEMAFGKRLVVRGSHYVIGGSYMKPAKGGKSLAAQERDLAQRKLLQAWTFVSPTNWLSYQEYSSQYVMEYSGLKRALPDNVQILTLEPWYGMNFLLRLEHYLEKNDDPILSLPVTVNLKDLFSAFEILSYRETTLGANQWLEENHRLSFNESKTAEDLVHRHENDPLWTEGVKRWLRDQTDGNGVNDHNRESYRRHQKKFASPGDFMITLNPMEIRTFVIDVKMLKVNSL